jgi:hypothetical protein
MYAINKEVRLIANIEGSNKIDVVLSVCCRIRGMATSAAWNRLHHEIM